MIVSSVISLPVQLAFILFYFRIYCFKVLDSSRCSFNKIFEFFKVFHCSVIKVLCRCLSTATLISYQMFSGLSTTFLFFAFILSNNQPSDSQIIILSINHLLSSFMRAEKEGFEPSRRSTRPIPLAGAPLRPLEYFSKVLCFYSILRSHMTH